MAFYAALEIAMLLRSFGQDQQRKDEVIAL